MPNTIADNLQRLTAARTAIGNAIVAKGGTVNSGDGFEDFPNAINSIPSGGGGSSNDAVRFMDYDGTVVQSYSAADFANLTALPANPSHTGLTSQGWNWSLADAKTYVTERGSLDIGQQYITSDGKTRIYVSLPEGRTSPILQLYLNANSELDVDWGDGGTHSTFTSGTAEYKSERHNYATTGDYVIAITVTTGSFVLQSSSSSVSNILWNGNSSTSSPDRAYNNSIQKIEIGTGITSIGTYAFNNCYSLSSITIPDSVISIGTQAFYSCSALSSVTIPDGVTTIRDAAFYNCSSLSSVTIGNSVTTIGTQAFYGCSSLSSVTIPDSVTSIGNNAFQNCYSLSSITIPDSVISIGNAAFYNCSSLSSITIPDSVTSIGSNAFYNCAYMSYIKFESTTPPTVSNSNAWSNVSTSTKILVPAGTLETYTTATNYPNSSTYTYEEY